MVEDEMYIEDIIEVEEYKDGLAFIKNGIEFAFWNFFIDKVRYYSDVDPEWYEDDSISVNLDDMIFIAKTCVDYRKTMTEIALIKEYL